MEETRTFLAQAIGAFHSRTIENKMAAAKHTKAMRCETMHPFYKLCSSEDPAFWLPEFGKSAATARLADKSLPCFPCNQWRDRQSRHRVRPSDSEKLVCCESGQGSQREVSA